MPAADAVEAPDTSAAAATSNTASAASSTTSNGSSTSTTASGGRRKNPGLTIDIVDTASASASSSNGDGTAGVGAAAAASPSASSTSSSSDGGASPISAQSSNLGMLTPTTPLDDDIDFSLVYALHTFVATMEGQVAVVRNEPLILLDDSNSYWWLVKPLRSNTIGYIPAEIVETPYERLARVNRQKNIERALFRSNDVPGAPSKSTRPSENPKSVQFPLDPRGGYFEYSPAQSEVSSDDDDDDYDPQRTTAAAAAAEHQQHQQQSQEQLVEDPSEQDDDHASLNDQEDEDEAAAEAARKRSSLGAGLLLRNRDEFDDEDENEAVPVANNAATAAAAGASPNNATAPAESPRPDLDAEELEDSAPLKPAPPRNHNLEGAHGPPARSSSEHALVTPNITVTPTDEDAAAHGPSASGPATGGQNQEIDPITVLRIYPGNCSIPADIAQFKTVVVTKSMTVHELLRQAILKYRVFGPLAADQHMHEDEILSDWYMSVGMSSNPNHYVLDPEDCVLDALQVYQQQSVGAPSANAAPSQQGQDGFLARFASKLYTPTLSGSARPSEHHLAKPILQVISPQDTSIRLMLHQHSVVASGRGSLARRAGLPADTALIKVVLDGETPSIGIAPPEAGADPHAHHHKARATAVALNMVQGEPVRVTKTVKVHRSEPVEAVVQHVLDKFARIEGRALGHAAEYDLFAIPDQGLAGAPLPRLTPLPLPPPQPVPTLLGPHPKFLLRRVAPGARNIIAAPAPALAAAPAPGPALMAPAPTLTAPAAAMTRPQRASSLFVDRPAASAAIVDTLITQPAPPVASRAPPTVTTSGNLVRTGSNGSEKRFSELLSEAQSLDLSHLFDHDSGLAVAAEPTTTTTPTTVTTTSFARGS
ncbi:hypothetical protein AMAG_01308 [Allomyces macrogynus ATCC 38327]|uniref:SH3 domain-containing protein n=1 Tax=Allomyces macrogynus (strain ATCC 38327) TaxID=578462 RepID=A0A0L0RYE5_ALLM3|nr:hypothetical protein AMAG_01308 [Allomyces macrogynus ATCC 38327]|eukprot:KNE55412.1 hypothetical protein AMAG_01308 [Allomyces macrogynus ATCC 38327]